MLYATEPKLISLLENEYLPCKEEWAKAWCCYISDFGQSITSHVEGLHAKLKSYPQVSTGFDVLNNIKGLTTNKKHQHESCLAWAHAQPCQEHCIAPEFKHLLHSVSPEGLELLHQQLGLAKDPHHDMVCTGSFTKKYGLPCVHTLKSRLYVTHEGVAQIELSEIHGHWHFQRLCGQASPTSCNHFWTPKRGVAPFVYNTPQRGLSHTS